jgi:metal-dependent amidase/aminoacylase/carboxypeptidase family protein
MAGRNQTVDEIAQHWTAMGHSVDLINARQPSYMNDDEWVDCKARNIEHLEIQKGQTHEDGTSWWTSEDFTAVDAAIAS